MRSLFKLINEDLKTIVKKPKRILKVSSLKKLRAYGWWVYARLMQGEPWVHTNGALIKRPYRTYEDYIRHQKSKLEFIELSQYDVDFRKILFDRLERLSLLRNGMTVLCLAAHASGLKSRPSLI